MVQVTSEAWASCRLAALYVSIRKRAVLTVEELEGYQYEI